MWVGVSVPGGWGVVCCALSTNQLFPMTHTGQRVDVTMEQGDTDLYTVSPLLRPTNHSLLFPPPHHPLINHTDRYPAICPYLSRRRVQRSGIHTCSGLHISLQSPDCLPHLPLTQIDRQSHYIPVTEECRLLPPNMEFSRDFSAVHLFRLFRSVYENFQGHVIPIVVGIFRCF